MGDKRLRALDTILSGRAAARVRKLVFLHHHPFIHNDPFMEVRDAREPCRTMYGRVDVVTFGRKHVPGMWQNNGSIPLVLAADSSLGKRSAREIVFPGGAISLSDVPVDP